MTNEKSIILEAIKKATGKIFDKDENDNLFKYLSPIEMVYVVKFIEDSSGKDLSDKLKDSYEFITLKGLESLI